MRFFPRGAFTAAPTAAVQMPVAQFQFQQAQQLQQLQQAQQQQQQFQQFQQQLYQQVGMPMAGPQATAGAPAYQVQQMQVQPQALAMQIDLRSDPLRMDPQLVDPAWYQPGMGGFGRPVF